MGSLIGRTVLIRVSLLNAVVALSTMFVLHTATGWLHHRSRMFHNVIQNRPVLLVTDGRLLDDALHRTGTSHVEIFQAARLQGLGSLDDVAAVTLERNGQFSLVTQDNDSTSTSSAKSPATRRSAAWTARHKPELEAVSPPGVSPPPYPRTPSPSRPPASTRSSPHGATSHATHPPVTVATPITVPRPTRWTPD
jgi:Protein of unknown function (DUF421)